MHCATANPVPVNTGLDLLERFRPGSTTISFQGMLCHLDTWHVPAPAGAWSYAVKDNLTTNAYYMPAGHPRLFANAATDPRLPHHFGRYRRGPRCEGARTALMLRLDPDREYRHWGANMVSVTERIDRVTEQVSYSLGLHLVLEETENRRSAVTTLMYVQPTNSDWTDYTRCGTSRGPLPDVADALIRERLVKLAAWHRAERERRDAGLPFLTLREWLYQPAYVDMPVIT